MSNPYIEDDGAEYPINNCVHCGQTDYLSGFDQTPSKPVQGRVSTVSRTTRKPFMPKVIVPLRK
ncbi:hypothetical protein [Pseudomonas sp. RA_35y_Pfl2_P32]|uniref:hypothetical protein n=1 Tax=Pseudomonas sp. RA_35y_Pfl2_P32 TaxID=3088705 RepID=UPI0030DD251B